MPLDSCILCSVQLFFWLWEFWRFFFPFLNIIFIEMLILFIHFLKFYRAFLCFLICLILLFMLLFFFIFLDCIAIFSLAKNATSLVLWIGFVLKTFQQLAWSELCTGANVARVSTARPVYQHPSTNSTDDSVFGSSREVRILNAWLNFFLPWGEGES